MGGAWMLLSMIFVGTVAGFGSTVWELVFLDLPVESLDSLSRSNLCTTSEYRALAAHDSTAAVFTTSSLEVCVRWLQVNPDGAVLHGRRELQALLASLFPGSGNRFHLSQPLQAGGSVVVAPSSFLHHTPGVHVSAINAALKSWISSSASTESAQRHFPGLVAPQSEPLDTFVQQLTSGWWNQAVLSAIGLFVVCYGCLLVVRAANQQPRPSRPAYGAGSPIKARQHRGVASDSKSGSPFSTLSGRHSREPSVVSTPPKDATAARAPRQRSRKKKRPHKAQRVPAAAASGASAPATGAAVEVEMCDVEEFQTP